MAATVLDVMRSCRNFFEVGYIDNKFTVLYGILRPADGIMNGQYIAIQGSLLHDGVYRLENGMLTDDADSDFEARETFSGRIWLLAPPRSFLALADEIAAFDAKTPAGAMQSESFGDYSYTRASGKNGGVAAWQDVFSARLAPYRRMITEVAI